MPQYKDECIVHGRTQRYSNGDVQFYDYPKDLPEIELQLDDSSRSAFGSAFGAVISCLGSAVGTGNIWRFPRILATHSYERGSLTFLIAWFLILFLWSIPIILVEYAIGRFTRNSPIPACCKFMGKKFVWLGGWLLVTITMISAYYPVIIGWCIYYLYISVSVKELPGTEEEGMQLFYDFARDSYWPVFFQILSVLVAGVFSLGGIRLVEKANVVLVPLLLVILVFMFGWSLMRPFAEVGIRFMFTPTFESLKKPGLYFAAAGQNAFDTGAGMTVLLTYATYMGRSSGITRYSWLIPMMNNLVSLFTAIAIFSTVFSTLIISDGTITRIAILRTMQSSGPGSTGLTFTWIPVLFSRIGIFGRVLCVLFFLCLSFAGISSLLADLQVVVLTCKELGAPHRVAVVIALLASILLGLPSAFSLQIMENQDDTFGYALIISGLLLAVVVITYNPLKFRRIIINEFGTDDWKVPIIWIPLITVLVPAQCVFLMIWWIYDYIVTTESWRTLTYSSVLTILIEWSVILVFLLAANLFLVLRKKDIYPKTMKIGCDPHNENTYVEQHIAMEKIRSTETDILE